MCELRNSFVKAIASAPKARARLIAPKSPLIKRVTIPSPSTCFPTILTFSSLLMPSKALKEAETLLVSKTPND